MGRGGREIGEWGGDRGVGSGEEIGECGGDRGRKKRKARRERERVSRKTVEQRPRMGSR